VCTSAWDKGPLKVSLVQTWRCLEISCNVSCLHFFPRVFKIKLSAESLEALRGKGWDTFGSYAFSVDFRWWLWQQSFSAGLWKLGSPKLLFSDVFCLRVTPWLLRSWKGRQTTMSQMDRRSFLSRR
jgi:hypothetical protein